MNDWTYGVAGMGWGRVAMRFILSHQDKVGRTQGLVLLGHFQVQRSLEATHVQPFEASCGQDMTPISLAASSQTSPSGSFKQL